MLIIELFIARLAILTGLLVEEVVSISGLVSQPHDLWEELGDVLPFEVASTFLAHTLVSSVAIDDVSESAEDLVGVDLVVILVGVVGSDH